MKALALMIAMGLTGCGGPTGYRCSAATCSGCCTAADVCEPGTAAKACGVGGQLFCRDCGTSLCSDAGVCFTPPTCSPTCRGCCEPDGRCIEAAAFSTWQTFNNARCMPSEGKWCVSCQAPQICGRTPTRDIGCIQPWRCAQSCGLLGCCDSREASCLPSGMANDAGSCI